MTASRSLLRKQDLPWIAIAGLIGEASFELYAWLVSPLLFGPALQPSYLVIAIVGKLTGIVLPYPVAFIMHFAIGSLGFGLLVYLVRRFIPDRTWLTGLVSGLILWFVAQGLLAPFIGRSFMMGFGAYTQSSFVGHVGMTLIMAFLLAAFLSRSAGTAKSEEGLERSI